MNALELALGIDIDGVGDFGTPGHALYDEANRVFSELDVDSNGQLKRQAIRDYIDIQLKGKMPASEVAKLFDKMDADHDNMISRTEFVSAFSKFQLNMSRPPAPRRSTSMRHSTTDNSERNKKVNALELASGIDIDGDGDFGAQGHACCSEVNTARKSTTPRLEPSLSLTIRPSLPSAEPTPPMMKRRPPRRLSTAKAPRKGSLLGDRMAELQQLAGVDLIQQEESKLPTVSELDPPQPPETPPVPRPVPVALSMKMSSNRAARPGWASAKEALDQRSTVRKAARLAQKASPQTEAQLARVDIRERNRQRVELFREQREKQAEVSAGDAVPIQSDSMVALTPESVAGPPAPSPPVEGPSASSSSVAVQARSDSNAALLLAQARSDSQAALLLLGPLSAYSPPQWY